MTTQRFGRTRGDGAAHAADLGACVLLKGATTVIAQGEDVAMNVTGCDGMGTAAAVMCSRA